MNRRDFSRSFLASSCILPLSNGLMTSAASANPLTPYNLTAISRSIEVSGRAATVFGLARPDGKFGLDLVAGDTAEVQLSNSLPAETLIHWHGITPALQYDGVPDKPMPLLKIGETRGFTLPAGKPGTHWMHAHTLQEQNLLAAPLIVRGPEDLARDEQDIVVLLHDFSFTPAEELLAKVKAGGGKGMHMSSGMMGMDINDIEYDAYLANDRSLRDPQVTQVEKGGNVRLRIINGATATAFIIDTGALAGEVIAVDGQDIKPIKLSQFPLSMGQRVDFRFNIPKDGGAYPILALREGAVQQTGILLAAPGATVSKIGETASATTSSLTLATEMNLIALAPLAAKTVDRSLVVNLVGNMMGYEWGMEPNAPLKVKNGERVLIEMRNRSMMTHPMHLHGHHFQIVDINGQAISGAVRDTVIVPTMQSVTFAFDANNPGADWAFHCHHLYHMASGMMSFIQYDGA